MPTDTPSAEAISALAVRLAKGEPLPPSSAQLAQRQPLSNQKADKARLTAHKAFLVDTGGAAVTVANKVANPFHLQADMAEALTWIMEWCNGEPD